MGHCVTFHTRQLIKDLGVGLGMNCMQGREVKHQQFPSFAEFSLVKNRRFGQGSKIPSMITTPSAEVLS